MTALEEIKADVKEMSKMLYGVKEDVAVIKASCRINCDKSNNFGGALKALLAVVGSWFVK